jgi:hypothetical protein
MMTRVYRDYAGRLDWEKSMARDWAETVKGWYGAQGGWVYSERGTVTQGWGSLFLRHKTEILDWYTAKLTAFQTFADLIGAEGYRPTLLGRGRGGWRFEALADAYDARQRDRHDPRRAYRG